MKDRNINLKVGLFVFTGLLLVILSIFAISGDQALFAEQYYLKTKFEQVTGLGPGSTVQVLGFPVGNVDRIEFEPDSKDLVVVMKIFAKYQDKINADAVADVRTKGALGDKYVYITPGRSERRLQDGEFVTASSEEDFLSRITSRGDEIDRVFSILEKIDQILTDMNGQRQVKQIMQSFQDSSRELRGITADLRSVSQSLKNSGAGEDLGQSLKKLSQVLDKIDRGEGSLGALINDPSVHDSLKRILGASDYNQTLKTVIRSSIKDSEGK